MRQIVAFSKAFGVTRSLIYKMAKAELSGGITLKNARNGRGIVGTRVIEGAVEY